MSAVREALAAIRARPGTVAIVCLGLAWGFTMHQMGWAQLAHYAQVRAFAEGQAEIDPWHWETNDKAYIDGHFYSVKSPGVAAVSTPLYMAIEGAGGLELADRAAQNARETRWPRWSPEESPSIENYGYDPERAALMEARIEDDHPVVWALTLLVAVIPALLLLVGVRRLGDRIQPGYGTAAAITLGIATMVMTFAAEYFSHVISAALGFAAFMVLMREREGPPSIPLVGAAGGLAGLAVTFEYQTGLVGVVLFFYALVGSQRRLPRAAVYAAGAVAGVIPALAFNLWAFGSPLEFAYSAAVAEPGFSGHETLGLNSDGFFGITAPRLDAVVDLLFANRGLLTITPVIAVAVAGVMLMRRGRFRTEANVIAAIAAVYFLYNAGYWLTFGGGTPGPRFLIPALPFVALGLAPAYRRWPAVTLALAIPSAVFMVSAALVYPLLGEQGPGTWLEFIWDGRFEHTLATVLGVSNAWVAIAPVVLLLGASVWFALKATPVSAVGDLRPALALLAAWAVVSVLGPSLAGDKATPLDGDPNAIWLVAIGATLSLLGLALLHLRGGGTEVVDDHPGELPAGDPEPGDRGRGRLGLRRSGGPVGVQDDAANAELP